MNSHFTYSILRYKHSLILGESINVGILFYFPEENIFQFVKGDGTRAKAIYPDFENSLFNGYIKNIIEKVKHHVDLFNRHLNKTDFSEYIHKFILAEDAAGLIFTDSVQVKNVFSDTATAIAQYSKLLLPGINTERPNTQRHNENFIISTFRNYLSSKNKDVEKKLERNTIVETKNFKIKFELSYKNKHKYFIKPLSFDLTEEGSIQNKAAITSCHLRDLADYPEFKKSSFDFLIAEPQNPDFKNDYLNALDYIFNVKSKNQQLVTQENWQNYYDDTYNLLRAN